MRYKNIIMLLKHSTGLYSFRVLLRKNIRINAVFVRKNLCQQKWYKELREESRKNKIKFFEVDDINKIKNVQKIKDLKPNLIISVFYDQIIKKDILKIPLYGIINFHPSLLPDYSGGNVVQWQIINGEPFLGVTTQFMDMGIDTGPIIYQSKFNIKNLRYIEVMHKVNKEIFLHASRLADLIVKSEKITYARQVNNNFPQYHARKPFQGFLNWKKFSIEKIYSMVQALEHPIFGAFIIFNKQIIKLRSVKSYQVIKDESIKNKLTPGRIIRVSSDQLGIEGLDGRIYFDKLEDINNKFLDPRKTGLKKGSILKIYKSELIKQMIGKEKDVDYSDIFKYSLNSLLNKGIR